MKLHQLRDYLAIAEKGSIRAAAKHLGIAQPALSRSIRGLEQEVGISLLVRHPGGAVLTELGKTFARRSGAAYQELRRALEELQQLQGVMQGEVAICLSSLSHVALVPSTLATFIRRFPKVKLRIIEGVYPVIERRLLDGTIDFYVGPSPTAGIAAGLRQEKLFENKRFVAARNGHPLRHATSLAELVKGNWITTSITDDPGMEFNDLFVRHGLPLPNLALATESLLTWLLGLTTTDMLAISPQRYLASDLINAQIIQIPVKEAIPGFPIMLVERAAIPLTPAAEYFADLLRHAATQQ
jgi:DNA-binding transcriptional LysR family regulator